MAVGCATSYIELTAAEDGRSHRVTQAVYDEGITAGRGRYATACGRVVLAASLNTAPGADCLLCIKAVRTAQPRP